MDRYEACVWKREARIVESSLISVLDKVIGRRLVTYWGLEFFFGIRIVVVSDHEGGGCED